MVFKAMGLVGRRGPSQHLEVGQRRKPRECPRSQMQKVFGEESGAALFQMLLIGLMRSG